jgi:RsiW-degrading membrane proteinase PrsW (M82 family)
LHDYTTLSDCQFVGFVEEPTKVLPLILLLIFARPAVNGTRDGLVYGALGGLGFAMLESSAYFALVNYPDLGWSSLFTETIGRASFLGTDIHILFAATLGAAIGFGVSTKNRWLGILVIIGGFLLVALTHGQQDHKIGKILAVGGSAVGAYVVMGLTGLPIEQLSQIQGTP